TVAVPTSTPDFAKDLYIANAAHLVDGDLVTIASATDKSFKEYLSTKGPEHGFAISDIQWSDKVGQTKVTIIKDGKYATLTFNQALLSQLSQNPNQPQMNAFQPQPFPPGMNVPPQPYQKPAPIPSLPPGYQSRQAAPQPQIHQRGVIQRNPITPAPTPIVPPPPSDDDSEE